MKSHLYFYDNGSSFISYALVAQTKALKTHMLIHKIYEPIVEKFKLRLQKVLSNVQWHFGLGHLQKLGFHQKHNLPTLLKKSIENQV